MYNDANIYSKNHMKIINELTKKAIKYFNKLDTNLRIDNIIIGKTSYTIKGSDTVFTDMNFCLVLFEDSYGFSYFQEEIDYSLSKFVNSNALDTIKLEIPNYLHIAILDAMYCLINRSITNNPLTFKGNLREKATFRATEILRNVPANSKIVLLGAVTEIIEEAYKKNCDISVFDLEKQKIGLKIYSKKIYSGQQSEIESAICNADFIVATGMIFVSGTADAIFEFANKHNKNLILYMETGSNFGPQLLEYGAKQVISEFFPFYDFHGDTKYLLSSK